MSAQAIISEQIDLAPFGPVQGQLQAPRVLTLRKNPIVNEAEEITRRMVEGTRMTTIAKDAVDLNAYAVGTMLARLVLRGTLTSVDDIFVHLNSVFSQDKMMRQIDPLRFNRRTVISTLASENYFGKKDHLKTLKPAGTNPSTQIICKTIEDLTQPEDEERVGYEEIISEKRNQPVVYARFLAIWVLRHTCGHSLTAIGKQLGGRDHTSIMNGLSRMAQKRIENEAQFRITREVSDVSDLRGVIAHRDLILRQQSDGPIALM